MTVRNPYVITLALAACLALLVNCIRQPPSLAELASQAKSVRLYSLPGHKNGGYSRSEIESAPYVVLDIQVLRDLAPLAVFKKENTFFKGSHLAVITMNDGRELLCAFGYPHDGKLMIHGKRGYYYFGAQAQTKWEEALKQAMMGGKPSEPASSPAG